MSSDPVNRPLPPVIGAPSGHLAGATPEPATGGRLYIPDRCQGLSRRSHAATAASSPHRDIHAEALRVADAAVAGGIPLRLIGGLAVWAWTPSEATHFRAREYADLDFVTLKRAGRAVGALLEELGYEPDRRFNAVNGHRRLLYFDCVNQRQADVFVGEFVMCHRVPLTDRLLTHGHVVPLAELLLSKLQIVELNQKDQEDILQLLYHHDVGESDDECVNVRYIAQLCAADWGLYRTCTMNLERSVRAVAAYSLPETDRELLRTRLRRAHHYLDSEPKGRRWQLRARVGDRVRWYQEPEEVLEGRRYASMSDGAREPADPDRDLR